MRLSFSCPAGLCPDHSKCYADNTRVARSHRVRNPPFCKRCFDKELAAIDKALIRADEDFYQNHNVVRQYLRAKRGRTPDQEDQDRIRARLRKNRNIDKEMLELEFYGPTRRIPHGRSVFLYQRLQRSFQSHQECMTDYAYAHDWDSSQDGDEERETLDDADWENVWQADSQAAQLANNDGSAQASEDGEYFHTQRRLYWEGGRQGEGAVAPSAGMGWVHNLERARDEATARARAESATGLDSNDIEPSSMPGSVSPSMDGPVLFSDERDNIMYARRSGAVNSSPGRHQGSEASSTASSSAVYAVRGPPDVHQALRDRREAMSAALGSPAFGRTMINEHVSLALPNLEPVVTDEESWFGNTLRASRYPRGTTSSEHRSPALVTAVPVPRGAVSDTEDELTILPADNQGWSANGLTHGTPIRRYSADNTHEDRRQGGDLFVRRGALGPLTGVHQNADDEPTGLPTREVVSSTAAEYLILNLLERVDGPRDE